MVDWSTTNKRKMKRRIVRAIKRLNKVIYDDDLWLGRFVCRIKRLEMKPWSDHSGLNVFCLCEFIDKKTDKKALCVYSSHDIIDAGKMFWDMNNFIVNIVDVWSENPSPRELEYRLQNNYRKEVI